MLELATLVERCRRGDGLAWESLVRRCQGRVFSVALYHLRDREEARDLAQDIFLRVYRRLDTFESGQSFWAWLMKVARNACIDRLRRMKARPPSTDVALEDRPELRSSTPSPEQDAELDARKRLLHRALQGMSEKNREIILLRDIQGLQEDQVADLLEVPLGTVKSRSNRARQELARRVQALDPSWGSAP